MINEILQLNDEIIMNDLNGNEVVVARMYCNITANKNFNITLDIIEQNAFNVNIEMCKTRFLDFKTLCEIKANENGVVVF